MAKENMILVDTNVLIEFLKNNVSTITEINNIGKDNISISIITYTEMLFGARNKVEFNKMKRYLDSMKVLHINDNISIIFKGLIDKYFLSHHIAIPDCFIASTALNFEIPLFTYNLKDFKFISDLRLYKEKYCTV